MVSAIAPKLNEIGFDLSKAQLVSGSPPAPGSSPADSPPPHLHAAAAHHGNPETHRHVLAAHIIPMFGWFFAVQDTTTSFSVLVTLSVLCGIGGGTFSGYMPSTGYFFPKRLSGTALALQSGIGNPACPPSRSSALGSWDSASSGSPSSPPCAPITANAGIQRRDLLVPWALVAAARFRLLERRAGSRPIARQQLDIFGNANTWYMTLLYVMTFGIHSGIAAQFALIINNNFGKDSQFAAEGIANLPTGLTYIPGPSASSVAAPSGVRCATSSAAQYGPSSPVSAWPSPSRCAPSP